MIRVLFFFALHLVAVISALIQIDATDTRISFVEKTENGEHEVSFIDADTFPKLERRLDALAALMEKGGRIYELEQKLKKLPTQAPTASPTNATGTVKLIFHNVT